VSPAGNFLRATGFRNGIANSSHALKRRAWEAGCSSARGLPPGRPSKLPTGETQCPASIQLNWTRRLMEAYGDSAGGLGNGRVLPKPTAISLSSGMPIVIR
jgi:hypothetical protein